MIVERKKLYFSFRGTQFTQFTIKIALNTQMQSSVNCVTEAVNL